MQYKHDLIHTNIPITELESKIINTGLFNRLQYTTQTSASYFTFPSLKHTRYAHSLGTMHIAGQMFSNIVKNTNNEIIENLYNNFELVINHILSKEYVQKINNGTLKSNLLSNISEYNKEVQQENGFLNEIIEIINSSNSTIYNSKLNIYQGINSKKEKAFYFLILQTIRACGLLHDVGHMPFSHLMENVIQKTHANLKEIVDSGESPSLTDTEREFYETAKEYFINHKAKPLHELFGDKISEFIFSELLTTNSPKDVTRSNIIEYLIQELVAFTFHEKTVKGFNFKKLHAIIDGIIDADRLDYVQRDIIHSGLNNIVSFNPEKLISNISMSNDYNLLFSSTLRVDLENFLTSRYESYKDIIFHPKVVRTNTILENILIEMLSSFLKNNLDNGIKLEPFELSNNLYAIQEILTIIFKDTSSMSKEDQSFDRSKISQFDESWLLNILKQELYKLQNKNLRESIDNIRLAELEEVFNGYERFFSVWEDKADFLNNMYERLSCQNGNWGIEKFQFTDTINDIMGNNDIFIDEKINSFISNYNNENKKIYVEFSRFSLGITGIENVKLQYDKPCSMQDVSLIVDRLSNRYEENLDIVIFGYVEKDCNIEEERKNISKAIYEIFEEEILHYNIELYADFIPSEFIQSGSDDDSVLTTRYEYLIKLLGKDILNNIKKTIREKRDCPIEDTIKNLKGVNNV